MSAVVRPWLSVVIPAYNEERRLPLTLGAVVAHLRELGRPFEVVVVDDGSADGTAGLARAAGPEVVLLSLPHRGKGAAVRAGVLASTGELTLVTDADLSTPIAELGSLLEALAGCEVAVGSRHVAGARIEVPQRLDRRLMGRAFNLLVRALLLPGVRDTQCGVKLFRREAALIVFERCRTEGFAFDVEVLSLARRLGYRVREVPVAWRNSPDSRVRPLHDVPRMFWELLAIRRRAGRAAAVTQGSGRKGWRGIRRPGGPAAPPTRRTGARVFVIRKRGPDVAVARLGRMGVEDPSAISAGPLD